MKIELLMRIRNEKKFATIDELVLAMEQDEVFSLNYIKTL